MREIVELCKKKKIACASLTKIYFDAQYGRHRHYYVYAGRLWERFFSANKARFRYLTPLPTPFLVPTRRVFCPDDGHVQRIPGPKTRGTVMGVYTPSTMTSRNAGNKCAAINPGRTCSTGHKWHRAWKVRGGFEVTRRPSCRPDIIDHRQRRPFFGIYRR